MGLIHDIRYLAPRAPANLRQKLYIMAMRLRGIDLFGVDASELGLSTDRSFWYQNSGGPQLDAILKNLSISSNDSVLDIGCGKAGALITMARYPFARVDGLDVSPGLVEIAKQNLSCLAIRKASVLCCDAADFMDFDPYTFLYMYNPFHQAVMEQMLGNLRRSLKRCPRWLTLVYMNPRYEELITRYGFHTVVRFRRALCHCAVCVSAPEIASLTAKS